MPSSLRPRPFVILLVVLGALVASWAASAAVAAQTTPLPEICLSVSRSATDVAGRSAIGAAVESALATRPVLIPDPLVAVSLDPAEPLRIGVWTDRRGARSRHAARGAVWRVRHRRCRRRVMGGPDQWRVPARRHEARARGDVHDARLLIGDRRRVGRGRRPRAHGADVLGPARHPQRHLLDGRRHLRGRHRRHARRDDDRFGDEPVRGRRLWAVRGVPRERGGRRPGPRAAAARGRPRGRRGAALPRR